MEDLCAELAASEGTSAAANLQGKRPWEAQDAAPGAFDGPKKKQCHFRPLLSHDDAMVVQPDLDGGPVHGHGMPEDGQRSGLVRT